MEPFTLQGVEGLDDGQGQRSQGGHALGGLQGRQRQPASRAAVAAGSASAQRWQICQAPTEGLRTLRPAYVPTGLN
jgi:hypothetical protein